MAWDGSGNFSRSNGTHTGSTTWANSRDAGNNITASLHDTHDQDLADGIAACLTKNNETKPTADFRPATDNARSLGSSALRWLNVYLSGFVGDANGNELLKFSATASAVNELTATNAATGKQPSLAATGGDTDISALVEGKGTGGVVASLLKHGGAYLIGGKITRSVGASALTLALKTFAGNDPSSTEPVFVIMPTVTSNVLDGGYAIRKITAAMSVVISSGSTLGHTSAVASAVYTYLIDNAGSVELAASTKYFGAQSVVSTTAEGGAGAADSQTALYSTTARTNVAAVAVNRWKSTQTTAGTWAATTGEVQLYPFPYKAPSVQVFTASGTYTKPWDMLAAKATAVASGGGGGGGQTAGTNGGGGGGAGGASIKTINASSIGATETVTVGAAGAGGATSGAGGVGAASSFGAHCSATGGTGGSGNGGAAVAGGTGASGDVNITGGTGTGGNVNATSNQNGAAGGSSLYGGTGAYGSGGTGGAANAVGAAGVAGIVVVEETYE